MIFRCSASANCVRFIAMTVTVLLLSWMLSSSIVSAQESSTASLAAGPDAPILLSPAEGELVTGVTHPPLGVPTLTWQAVSSATMYQVQISTSSGFSINLVSADTGNTSYTPLIALGDGIYYWRVRARAGTTWGEFSGVSSFTVNWGHNGEIHPVLLAPENGAAITAFAHAHFSWLPVPGAATYQLRIATDPQMTSAAYTVVTTKPHHTPLQRLGNNVYYWQVTPVDNKGHVGASSPIWSFTFNWNIAPQLLIPDDEAELLFTPRLSWAAVEGAKEYRLQISTQENFVAYDQIITRNTDYTPVKALSNDQDYFWRVQAVDARNTVSPWSEIRRFRMKWNFKPQLLSPTNNSIHLSYPFFSWAPVPGAERYQIQIAANNDFRNPKIADKTLYNVTNYIQTSWPSQPPTLPETAYYWQVRAIDAQGNTTPWSETWSFQFSDPTGSLNANSRYPTTPNLIYPLPFYDPDTENTPVHGDRSFGSPVFIWDTAHIPGYPGSVNYVEPADFYLLEVDDNMDMTSPNFSIATAGLAAAPTLAHPFNNLQPDSYYYWQVTAYKDGSPIGSKVKWRTRYNPAVSRMASVASAEAIHPADGFEAVAQPPVLGWLPVLGASRYRVQIAEDPEFLGLVEEAIAQFVNYVPWQGKLTPMPYGAYWWRVRGEDSGGAPIGDWSAARRFNLSVELAIGNIYDFPPLPNLTTDTSGRAHVATNIHSSGDEYALYDLYVTADRRHDDNYNQHWVFALRVGEVGDGSISYALYFDTDHAPDSGGDIDPRGNAITSSSLYRPEYILYINKTGASISTFFYRWLGNQWAPPQSLDEMRGFITDFGDAFQVLIPYTALSSADTHWVGSLALAAFSLDDAGTVRDTLPAQPEEVVFSRPVFVSNMLLPLYPFDTPLSNPIVFEDMPPLRWRMPAYGSDGYQVEIARDAKFTDIVERWDTFESSEAWVFTLMPATFQSLNAYANNESYYWRVRVRHEKYAPRPRTDFDFGPWSPPMRFRLDSRRVGNPRLSTGENAFMTPTFLWDRVEGASGYTIQIDDDANFSSPLINQATDATSFTPLDSSATSALLPGVQYYWRVVMRRTNNIIGQWSDGMAFTKNSLWPEPVTPFNGAVLNHQPTLQWTAILTPSQGPRLAAPAYRVQVANNPSFNPIKLDETTQSTSYTPPKGKTLTDGVWYWRVAFIDGAGKLHPFSPAQSFTKEYPLPVLLGPAQGENTGVAPIFTWAPIHGAASYKLEYADNSSYNKSTVVTTDLTSHVPTKTMSNSPYFWRVQMIDADKNPGPLIEGRFVVGYKLFLPAIQSR